MMSYLYVLVYTCMSVVLFGVGAIETSGGAMALGQGISSILEVLVYNVRYEFG